MGKFGERLRELMTDNGVTAAELSRGTGIPTGLMSRYVNAEFDPKLSKVAAIANYFSVSPL